MIDINDLIEVRLRTRDDFLKVAETLTRIGVASHRQKKLYQSCHILHKQNRYFIVHFKELIALDGNPSNFDETDKLRRNAIANRLHEWGKDGNLGVELVDPTKIAMTEEEMKRVFKTTKIIHYGDKANWELIPKYVIGKKKTEWEK